MWLSTNPGTIIASVAATAVSVWRPFGEFSGPVCDCVRSYYFVIYYKPRVHYTS